MKSEALRNVGTMRQVKTSLDIARSRKFKTTNASSRTKEEVEYLESLTDRRLDQVLEKERRRFAVQETAIDKSRRRVLRARENLAMTVNRNRALAELRRELQQTRGAESDPVASQEKKPAAERKVRQIELNY